MNQPVDNLIEFYRKAEKLKSTMRHSWLSEASRQESTAEHTWMMSLLAILLSDSIDPKMDTLKALKMIIIHDLAEAITGDIPSFEISKRKEEKENNERGAFKDLLILLPESKATEIMGLWEEFEANETIEAQFAQSLDKLEATMQHNLSDITQWTEGEFRVHPYYRDEYFDFNPTMRTLKDSVDKQSMRKIISAGMEDRIEEKHLKRFERTEGK